MGPLRDALGRDLHYLRLSITDRCNFRCVYCLPDGCGRPAPEAPLAVDEIGRLTAAFAALGFWKVRLTGGEPTLRPDLCDVVRRVARTPGVRRVGLTTNGLRLAALAGELARAGLTSLNVSVDSLDPVRFEEITGSAQLPRVIQGIDAALAAGIPAVKVNVVLLRDTAGPEVERFLRWTRRAPLTVRFIELMETGDNVALFRRERVAAEGLRAELERSGWRPLPREAGDGPAENFEHPEHVGRAGIISAYRDGFCGECNRLRVTANGDLRTCLFGEEGVSLRPLLQRDDGLDAAVRLIRWAVERKPASHQLATGGCGSTRHLAQTGG
jgi:cyclic pyranopterin phosphate synthase